MHLLLSMCSCANSGSCRTVTRNRRTSVIGCSCVQIVGRQTNLFSRGWAQQLQQQADGDMWRAGRHSPPARLARCVYQHVHQMVTGRHSCTSGSVVVRLAEDPEARAGGPGEAAVCPYERVQAGGAGRAAAQAAHVQRHYRVPGMHLSIVSHARLSAWLRYICLLENVGTRVDRSTVGGHARKGPDRYGLIWHSVFRSVCTNHTFSLPF